MVLIRSSNGIDFIRIKLHPYIVFTHSVLTKVSVRDKEAQYITE